ncbi:MAG: bifunctional AAA family ATPase chaperone/translocase BCS1 [Barrevirus sp.]|uniref:Bifunctional AAA family ATPase chaperone/translocase BCS1 n=1 Tax=Barrevirus sp. TaxID=2487763 RepID=A0A3G4ZSK5_9VIRU|nr:MAG: bifunctional AAA family ATPase chaperone/translocase BCS1 [Barrevirus sp.]
MAATYISKLMDQTDMSVFSVKNLVKVIAVLSIDELRNVTKSLFSSTKEHLPSLLKYLWGKTILLWFMSQKIKWPLLTKRKPIALLEQIKPILIIGSNYSFEWKNCQIYSKLIYNQLTTNKKVRATKIYGTSLKTVEHGKNVYSVEYRDIKIPIDDDKFIILDRITYKSDLTFEIPKDTTKKRNDCLSDYIDQTPFGTLVKEYSEKAFKYCCTLHGEKYKFHGDLISELDGLIVTTMPYSKIIKTDITRLQQDGSMTAEEKLFRLIMHEYPEFDHRIVFLELQIIIYHYHLSTSSLPAFNLYKLRTGGGTWGTYATSYFSQINFGKLDLYSLINKIGGLEPTDTNRGTVSFNRFASLPHLVGITYNNNKQNKNNKPKGAQTLNVRIESLNSYSDEELLNSFIQYLDINTGSSNYQTNKEGKEINIYELKLVIHKKVEQIDNPEYISWKELKDELVGDGGEKDNNVPKNDNGPIKKAKFKQPNIQCPPPPKKFIEKITLTKEIVKTEVNSTYKSINTLYLPNNMTNNLLKILDNFSNKKNGLFKRLGIPNKLGICLYGLAGTGKSTTIKVIGSYLGKDIYYLNLEGVTKNSELKLLFDFVIKTCSEGGIIVFEDIDVMTNIVRPRQTGNGASSDKLTDVLNSDELNLSYLLNLLDGTLCAKNTIFIMTTNHIKNLDPALVRPGRCDIQIELKNCDKYQIKSIWQSVMETELDENILISIPEYTFTPADLIFHLIEYVYQIHFDPEAIFNDLYRKLKNKN